MSAKTLPSEIWRTGTWKIWNSSRDRLNVWCAFSHHEVIGSFKRRLWTVQIFLLWLSYLQSIRWHTFQPNVTLQRDGAPPCWGFTVRQSFNRTFPHIVGLGGMDQSLGLLTPQYNSIWIFFLGGWGYVFHLEVDKCGWTPYMNQQCSALCDIPGAGKHMAWNQILFGHSVSYTWCWHWVILNLMRCSF
jgi:hypothetical protein